MAILFPLDTSQFADLLSIETVKWRMHRNDEMSGLANGQTLVAELAPPLWIGDVELNPMYNEDADQLQAVIESLDGSIGTFYMYAPQRPYPQYDPTGSILGANVPTIQTLGANNKSMRVQGLPAAYKLTRGDFLAFTYLGRRAFHRIVETVTADGTGLTPFFEVRPHIRPGAVVGTAVILKKPSPECRMVPDGFESGDIQALITSGMSFQVIQRL